MKTIKGVTLEELNAKVIFAVEIEPECGGRYWIYGTDAEVSKRREQAAKDGELSDIDIVVIEKQPEDIRECLEEVERLYRDNGGKLTWQDIFEEYGDDDRHNLSKDNLLAYIKAGRATITLHSGITGKHFTYQINKCNGKHVWFVSLMTGTNNDEDFSYLGYFYHEGVFKTSDKSCVKSNNPAYLAFDYFLKHINKIPEKLGVFHAGKCCRCGRTLTTPESVQTGIGPECRKLMVV